MKKIIKNIFIRNFKKIPYFFETKPRFHIEQNNYALIGKLSTSLLHDILTPLTSLSLSTELEEKYSKPIIKDSTKQITEYVEILKDFLYQTSKNSPLHVNAEIHKCLTLLRHKTLIHNIQIQYIEFDQIHTHIHPLHIYQIIINLISNATEASISSETKKIILILRKIKKEFYIECRDFGTGIPENIIEKIGTYNFSTKSSERGFGLYSVKYIIEEILQGTLLIESEPNQGSLFSCKIPLI